MEQTKNNWSSLLVTHKFPIVTQIFSCDNPSDLVILWKVPCIEISWKNNEVRGIIAGREVDLLPRYSVEKQFDCELVYFDSSNKKQEKIWVTVGNLWVTSRTDQLFFVWSNFLHLFYNKNHPFLAKKATYQGKPIHKCSHKWVTIAKGDNC